MDLPMNANLIAIDPDWIVTVAAVRYAIGRSTAVPPGVADHLATHWPAIPPAQRGTIHNIIRQAKEATDNRLAMKTTWNDVLDMPENGTAPVRRRPDTSVVDALKPERLVLLAAFRHAVSLATIDAKRIAAVIAAAAPSLSPADQKLIAREIQESIDLDTMTPDQIAHWMPVIEVLH